MLLSLNPTITKADTFKVVSFNPDFYFPPKSLQEGLKEVILFTEPLSKRLAPNGSVFVYHPSTPYNPAILRSDVGCGIMVAKTDYIDKTDIPALEEIVRTVDTLGIHIGQGNHFFEISEAPGNFPKSKDNNAFLYIHSDFNPQQIIPKNYGEVKKQIAEAKNKREEFLIRLTNKLGISYSAIGDWTHNSIQKEGDEIVYRKGSIKLTDNNNLGILGLNPLTGCYFYSASIPGVKDSMQHGVGPCSAVNEQLHNIPTIKIGSAIGYLNRKFIPAGEEDFYDQIRDSKKHFWNHFGLHTRRGYHTLPFLRIRTKG